MGLRVCVRGFAVMGAVAAIAGCGAGRPQGAAPQTAATTEGGAGHDPASRLVRLLPAGADRCVVARTGRLAQRRRVLFRRVSQGGPLAWLGVGRSVEGFGGVAAHAQVERYPRDLFGEGRRPRVTLLAVDGERKAVRRALEAADVRLRWDGPCEQSDCAGALDARFVDPHTVRIERGKWPQAGSPGVERRCAELLQDAPEAVEVSVRHGEKLLPGDEDVLPERVEDVLRVSQSYVRLRRRQWMPGDEAARRAIKENLRTGGVGDRLVAGSWWSRDGSVVTTGARYVWEDLRIAWRQERRGASKEAEDGKPEPDPVSQVDVRNLAAAKYQVRLRRHRLEQQSGAARRSGAEKLVRLFERILAEHPHQYELAHRLVRLLLDELGEPERARQVAEDVLARGPPSPGRWERVLREVQANRGTAALAKALRRDGLAEGQGAARAAADLRGLLEAGMSYAEAERAWRTSQRIARQARKQPLGPAPSARLPVGSLAQTLQTLLRHGGLVGAGERALHASIRASRSPEGLHTLRGPRGREMALVSVWRGEDSDKARTLDERLQDALRPGRVELTIAFAAMDGPTRPAVVVRLAGKVVGSHLELHRAGGRARRVGWGRVARYLAEPLASIEDRLFPRPEVALEFRAVDRSSAERIVTLAASRRDLVCRRDGSRVRCEVPRGRRGGEREFVSEVARELLEGEGEPLL